MNCRGRDKRRQIVKDYNIEPVAHLKLLHGQSKRSDAEAKITDQYYIFKCTHKLTGEHEIIQCGMGAARDFLDLINMESIPIFNPLRQATSKNMVSKNVDTNNNKSMDIWNPVALQLYNAIMILIIAWDASADTKLFKLKKEAEKYKSVEPFLERIQTVNNIISKDYYKRTMLEIVSELGEKNDIKEYKFDLLTGILSRNNIQSNF